MFPRRRSTNVTPTHVPPQPRSGSVGGRRPLSLITDRQPFRAFTTQTVETKPPVSKTEPQAEIELQEIPPLFPQQSHPHLPPGNSELRRQSTRRDTYDTRPSAPEEEVSSQGISDHPSTPVRPLQHAPGGDAGGSAVIPPSPHNAADYAYQFDSRPAYNEPAGTSEGIHVRLWPTYNKVSQEFDEKRLKLWNEDLDVLLIFAALFSAIVTAFLIRALDDLGPNYQQQSALLLYQLLNGRDPNLANISNPTIPQRATSSAIAVNCLWFASLSTSLGASLCAIICKGWLTEYNSGTNPIVGLLRACKRHMRFMAFQKLKVHTLVAYLPVLLHSSVLLFFAGAVVYLSQMDERVMIVFAITGGIFGVVYLLLTILPFVTDPPFRPFSASIFYRLYIAIRRVVVTLGKAFISIIDIFAHTCYFTLRYLVSAILWPFARIIFHDETLQRWYVHWYMQIPTILQGEYRPNATVIVTNQKIQEEAIVWLSEVPLDPVGSKALVSSLALISSSSSHKFQMPVILFLNSVLEASFREEDDQERTDTATECVLVLGLMKFQSAVDQNLDRDHSVGGTSITASVAWAAQQLVIDAFQAKLDTPHSEEIRARLLTAATWLSPADGEEDVEWSGGEKLKIQDRSEFIEKIKMMVEQHVRGSRPLSNKILVNLIHGMHACIPRGDYHSLSSIASFPPLLSEDCGSPWSEDEGVIRALITYALDLLLPHERKPLVGREINFGELASELFGTLANSPDRISIVPFAFWLIHRVPYAFKSRKTTLSDISHIWTLTEEVVPEGYRERMNFHAVDGFVKAAQFYACANGTLPKFTPATTLRFLNAVLESDHCRPMTIYAMAMILYLGTPTQVTAFMSGIRVESFIETLFSVRSDLERNTPEEDVVDLHIYSTLVLLKLRPVELDVGKVKELIEKMGETIGNPSVGDTGVARNFEADLDRVRWKAVYLSALLFTFLAEDETEERMERFRDRVRVLLRSGGLPLAGDHKRCLGPLGMGELELGSPVEQLGPESTAFEVWINGFPLVPLAGSVFSART